jgi:hypothetical protein
MTIINKELSEVAIDIIGVVTITQPHSFIFKNFFGILIYILLFLIFN